jgi:hypothetical protein
MYQNTPRFTSENYGCKALFEALCICIRSSWKDVKCVMYHSSSLTQTRFLINKYTSQSSLNWCYDFRIISVQPIASGKAIVQCPPLVTNMKGILRNQLSHYFNARTVHQYIVLVTKNWCINTLLALSLLMSYIYIYIYIYIYGAPSKARNLTSYIYGRDFAEYFASWTVNLVNICVKNQQIHQSFVQLLIMYGSSYMFRHYPQYSIDSSSIEHLPEGTTNATWWWQCNAETCRSYHT